MNYPQGPNYSYGHYPNPASQDTNLATVALVLAIVGWMIPFASIAGVVVGHVAHAKASRGEAGGKGIAKAALAIGYTWLAMIVLGLVILFLWVLAQKG